MKPCVQLRFMGNTYSLDPTAQQKPRNLATVGRLHGGDDALVADAHVDRPVQLCKEGNFLCGLYKRDFLSHGRTCPGVTDVTP
jgi:hypothetical protein